MRLFVNGWDPEGFPLNENDAIQVTVTKTPQEGKNPIEFVDYPTHQKALELIKNIEGVLSQRGSGEPACLFIEDLIAEWKKT